MRKKCRVGGALLIVLAIIIMQLPTETVEAADSTDFVMEGMSLSSYKGKDKIVSIPAGVEAIGEKAFEDNSTLEKVVFPSSLKRIGAYAFWGCDALKDISFGKGIKEISDFAFTNCKGLKELQIPSNINYIGVQAFADCVNLTDITIPANVTYIHETAFDGCSKLVIHCQEGSYASEYAKEFYKRKAEFPEYEDVPDFEPGTEEENPQNPGESVTPDGGDLLGYTSVVGNQAVLLIDSHEPTVYQGVIPQGQEPIQGSSQEANKETEQKINQPVKYRIVDGWCVADQAYYRDDQLQEIVLPGGVREIGEFSFARSAAGSLVILTGVEKISYGAFYHCDNLGKVRLSDTIETVEPKAFEHTLWVENFKSGKSEETGDFLVSGGVLIAYRGQESEVHIPEGVRVISAECFLGREEIQTVILPTGLKNIGEGAFEGCSSLRAVEWNKDLQKISDRAFSGCGLEEVGLPNSVKYLGMGAFDPDVKVSPVGKGIQTTYETSAQRLSNASYRYLGQENPESGQGGSVLTLGMEGSYAELEGADRAYTLRLQEENGKGAVDKASAAFRRNLGEDLPEEAKHISCVLTDSSEIPLTKLGKQTLHIVMPVSGEFAGQEIAVYMYDRNGQLERIAAQRYRSGDNDVLSFSVTKVYDLILVPTGRSVSSEEISEAALQEVKQIQAKLIQQAAGVESALAAGTVLKGEESLQREVTPVMVFKWIAGGLFLIAGLFLALKKVR